MKTKKKKNEEKTLIEHLLVLWIDIVVFSCVYLLTTNFVVFFCSVVVASLFGSVCYCRLHSEKKKETYILGDAWINAFYRCFCFVQLEGRTNIYIFIWNNVEFPQKYRNSETKFYLHIMHQYLICVVLYCNWWAL